MTELDEFYSTLSEPLQSTFLALRNIILELDPEITAAWKYKLPFFHYKKKMFCYIWKDKKTGNPYIGIVRGKELNHHELFLGKRKKIPILPLDLYKDLPIEKIQTILHQALALYD